MRKLSSQLRLARPLLPALLIAVAVFLLLGSSSATAATPSCGDTITHDTTLTADLTNCPGDGLDIGADNIILNLNGHTIDGTVTQPLVCGQTPPDAEGVRVGGFDGVTIKNGTIQHFSIGIDGGAEGDGISNAYFHDLVVRDNGVHGISIGVIHFPPTGGNPSNENNRIERNEVYGNNGCGGRGIFLNSTADNHVAYNRTHDNGEGIGVCCSEHTVVEHNNVVDERVGAFGGAIEVAFGSDNVVRYNDVSGTRADGISIGEGEQHDIVRNNHSHGNGGAGVTLNEARANRVDGNRLDHDLFGVISFVGDGNTISGNDISDTSACPPDPCGFGVAIAGGDGNVVAANQVARTALDGIAVVALDPGDTTSNTLLRDNFVRAAAHDDYSVGAVGAGTVTDTRLAGNLALTAAGDGFDIFTAGTTLTRNKAFANGNLGFEAVAGTIDGGGNLAHGNGNPAQCTGVVCG